MKIICAIISFIGAIFSVIGVLILFVLGYYVLNAMWDYAYLNFGDLGVGFMVCLSIIMILWLLVSIAKDIFRRIYRSKEEKEND